MLAPLLRLLGFGVTAGAAAVAGVLVSGPDLPAGMTFGHDLITYAAEKPKIRKLPDGGRIAVGSRTGHDVTVQWRDPASHTWSAPQEIQRQDRLWTHSMSVQQSHGTVAIAPDFWVEEVLDDDYSPTFTTLSVCRDYRCSEPRTAGWLSGPVLAEDGQLVAFGTDEDSVLLWENGTGYRTSRITGMPRGDRRVRVLPDGSFAGVIGRWDGRRCHYVLYTAGHRSTAFSKEIESPGFFDEKPCHLSGVDITDDGVVEVWIESLSDGIEFRRDGNRWTVGSDALSRMQIKNTLGASTMAPLEARHGRVTTLFGSHDRERILMQVRPDPDQPWSPPRVVATAPKGTVCRNGSTGSDIGMAEIVMVLVHCYTDQRQVRDLDTPSDVAIVLASTDGKSWIQQELREPRWDPLPSRHSVLAVGQSGSLLYRGGKKFDDVRLPVNSQWDGIGFRHDGTTLLRVIGNDDAQAMCRPTWTTASVTATAWEPPKPLAADGYPRPGTCSGSINEESPGHFMVGVYAKDYSWEFTMRLRGGQLEEAPPLE